MRMRHVIVCGLPECKIFFDVISFVTFFGNIEVIEHKMPVSIFAATFA
jgi:hypothetical protein